MTMQQKILPPEFGNNKEKPFDGDLLNREWEIKSLTPMICNIKSPATMALDAEWGAGKTAFIKMWAAYLNEPAAPNNEASARAFYFNAWETDFAADPFVPFVEAITAEMSDDCQKLMESAKVLAPAIGDAVGRAMGAGAFVDVAKKAAGHFFAPKSEINKFQQVLKDFVASQKDESHKEGRVVIFVDELDRCRPDYAVKVLERIKHLFEVPGVVFVLATNREQLCHSINALYGATFNADAYLRRFIEFDYTIKQPDMARFISARLNGLGINEFLSGRKHHAHNSDRNLLHETLTLLAKLYNLSLRDVEQLLMRVVLVLWSLEDKGKTTYHFYPVLLAFLVVARLKAPKHYRQYSLPVNNWEGMVAYWHEQLESAGILNRKVDEGDDASIASYITAHIILAKGLFQENTIKTHKEKWENAAHNNKVWYFRELMRHIQHLAEDFSRGIDLPYLVNKIEMLDQFRFPDADSTKG